MKLLGWIKVGRSQVTNSLLYGGKRIEPVAKLYDSVLYTKKKKSINLNACVLCFMRVK